MAVGSDTRRLERMYDLTPAERLEKQRTLRDWLAFQLRQAEQAIEQLEREIAEDQRRREVARVEQSWKLQPGRGDKMQPMLHRGNCGLYKTELGYLDKAHVIIAIEEFPQLEMCDICKPWGLLGIPKPG